MLDGLKPIYAEIEISELLAICGEVTLTGKQPNLPIFLLGENTGSYPTEEWCLNRK